MVTRSGKYDKSKICSYPSYSRYIVVVAQLLTSLARRGDYYAMNVGQGRKGSTVYDGVKCPPISIEDYLNRWARYSYCSPETFVLAVMYIDRLSQMATVLISSLNVHRLLLTSLVIAAKVRDDVYFSNRYYASIGGIPTSEMNRLEIAWLTDTDWDLYVTRQDYNIYVSQFEKHKSTLDGQVVGTLPSNNTIDATAGDKNAPLSEFQSEGEAEGDSEANSHSSDVGEAISVQ